MQPSLLVAIDPGAAGAAVLRRPAGDIIDIVSHDGDPSILTAVRNSFAMSTPDRISVVIEQVWASPVMGVSSAFAFGCNFGKWVMAFKANGLPVWAVTPQQWQRVVAPEVEGQGGDRKRALKAVAKERFPSLTVTLAICDALLISEYALARHKAGKPLGEEL